MPSPSCAPRAPLRRGRPPRALAFQGVVWLLGGCCAAGGCVTYEPEPLDPSALLRDLERRADSAARPVAAAPFDAWFPLAVDVAVEDGLSLAEANALALHHAPAVRAARADAGVRSSEILRSGLLADPQVFVGPRLSLRDAAMIFPASLTWEVVAPEELTAERAAAVAGWSIERQRVVQAELAVLVDVRGAFLHLAGLARRTRLWAEVVASAEGILTWVEGLAAAGEADALTLYLARSERDAARSSLTAVEIERAERRRELLELLGMLPDAPVEFVATAESNAIPELAAPRREAWFTTPGVRIARAAYDAAEAELRLAIARRIPGFQIGPQFESDRGDPTLGFGVQVSLPLFGERSAAVEAARRARDRAREGVRAALLEAAHVEARARGELAASERLLDLHVEGAWRSAEEAASRLTARLRIGGANVVEILSAQRAIGHARAQRIELEERVIEARFRAAVASGLPFEAATARGEEVRR